MRAFKHRFHSPFQLLYDEARLAPIVRRSLSFMLLANICGSLCGVVCGANTNAMIGLANYFGAGDFAFGLLNGIPQAAALMQIPFSILVSRTHKRKKYILTYGVISRAMWLLFGALPFLFPQTRSGAGLIAMLAILSASSLLSACINVCWFPWFADLTPIGIRGRWLSIRDMFNALANVLFGLCVARVLDVMPGNGKYLVVFTLSGALGVMDMVFFGFVKEAYASPPRAIRVWEAARDVYKNKPFMRFMAFWTAWCFTSNMSGAYLNRYALGEMGLSYMSLTLAGAVAASAVTILVISRWGRLLDAFGCKPVMCVSGYASAISLGLFLLMRPGNIWPYLAYNLLSSAFACATVLACNSMQLSYSPDDERASYIAFFSCVTCLIGTALGTVSGGALLEGMEGLFAALSISWDRYKALIAISLVLRVACVYAFVPGLGNDREGDEKQLLRALLPRRRRFK